MSEVNIVPASDGKRSGGPLGTGGKRAPVVFISYCRDSDRRFALRLKGRLSGVGIDVWIDDEMRASNRMASGISEALANADRMILVMSKSYFSSDWCSREYNAAEAVEKRKPGFIMPVLRSRCIIPPLLEGRKYVDVPKYGFESVVGQLVAEILHRTYRPRWWQRVLRSPYLKWTAAVVLAITLLIVIALAAYSWLPPSAVTVPSLVNLEIGAAQALVKDSGLEWTLGDSDYDDGVAYGRILRSSPKAGERVRRHTTVVVTKSRGREPVDDGSTSVPPPPPSPEVALKIDKRVYTVGDRLAFTVKARRDCYLYIADLQPRGNPSQLVPNKRDTMLSFVNAGQEYEVPPDLVVKPEIPLDTPTGKYWLWVFASSSRFRFTQALRSASSNVERLKAIRDSAQGRIFAEDSEAYEIIPKP